MQFLCVNSWQSIVRDVQEAQDLQSGIGAVGPPNPKPLVTFGYLDQDILSVARLVDHLHI